MRGVRREWAARITAAHLPRRPLFPLAVQQRHDCAKRRMEASQRVAQADVGAHGRAVGIAVDVPATGHCWKASKAALLSHPAPPPCAPPPPPPQPTRTLKARRTHLNPPKPSQTDA